MVYGDVEIHSEAPIAQLNLITNSDDFAVEPN